MVHCALFAALIAICAWISVPVLDIAFTAEAKISRTRETVIAQGDYGTDSYEDFAYSVPVYGEYEDVYVVFYPGSGSTWVTSEIVNGLKFTYGSSLQIKVFTPEISVAPSSSEPPQEIRQTAESEIMRRRNARFNLFISTSSSSRC